MLPVGSKASGEERLFNAGLELLIDDSKTIIDNVVFGSIAEKQKLDFDFEIVTIEVETSRPAKQWFYVPAFFLLGLLINLQRRRFLIQCPNPSLSLSQCQSYQSK